MNQFEFISGGIELLNFVKPLWEKLNQHHADKASYFSDWYQNFTFDARRSKFYTEQTLKVKIDLIKDVEKNAYIGYCITTISKDFIGEIDSLFIEKEYQNYGLGDKLMHNALEWFNQNQVKTKSSAWPKETKQYWNFIKSMAFIKGRLS